MAVGFWNFTGAGIFGFLINMPIVSYFEMGTNLTPNHGHAAMMGVFGMLGVALMVFVLRQTTSDAAWPRLERYVRCGFWGLNIGLAMMVRLQPVSRPASCRCTTSSRTATGTRAASPIRRARCRGCSNGCACRATWCSSSWARCRSRSPLCLGYLGPVGEARGDLRLTAGFGGIDEPIVAARCSARGPWPRQPLRYWNSIWQACPRSESGGPKSKATSTMTASIAMKPCVELVVF